MKKLLLSLATYLLGLAISDVGGAQMSDHRAASPQAVSPGRTRTYYIAADEVPWDSVPGGIDGMTGKPFKALGYFWARRESLSPRSLFTTRWACTRGMP